MFMSVPQRLQNSVGLSSVPVNCINASRFYAEGLNSSNNVAWLKAMDFDEQM